MKTLILALSVLAFSSSADAAISIEGKVSHPLTQFEFDAFAVSPECTYREPTLDGWKEYHRTNETSFRIPLSESRYSLKQDMVYRAGFPKRCTYELGRIGIQVSFKGYKSQWGEISSYVNIGVWDAPTNSPKHIHLSRIRAIGYTHLDETNQKHEYYEHVWILKDGTRLYPKMNLIYILSSDDKSRFELDIEVLD